jgi:cell division initiation protein
MIPFPCGVFDGNGRSNGMNYAPEELENTVFRSVVFGGYDKSSVDEAIRKIVSDYHEREKEALDLKSKVDLLTETVNHYKTIEESMQHCLIIAQHTSDEMISNANEKAKDILDQAGVASQKLVDDAYRQVNKIKFSYDDIQAKLYTFKVKNEALLKSQLDILGQISSRSGAADEEK